MPDMNDQVIAYKGFKVRDGKLTCHNFIYEEGKAYYAPKVKLCECGFHACTYPLDVFNYYYEDELSATKVEYHVVEFENVSLEREADSKICAKKITIGRKITPAEMIEISKASPAEPIEHMFNSNLESCFFIKDDVTKAEPIIRNAEIFVDHYNLFVYCRLSDGKIELNYTEVYLPDLENYSFWKGVPTQERLDEYYERKKHAREN